MRRRQNFWPRSEEGVSHSIWTCLRRRVPHKFSSLCRCLFYLPALPKKLGDTLCLHKAMGFHLTVDMLGLTCGVCIFAKANPQFHLLSLIELKERIAEEKKFIVGLWNNSVGNASWAKNEWQPDSRNHFYVHPNFQLLGTLHIDCIKYIKSFSCYLNIFLIFLKDALSEIDKTVSVVVAWF